MIKRILPNICICLLVVFISIGNTQQISINSLNALRVQDKEIELKYEDKSVKVNIKTLRNKKKLSKVLNQSLFYEKKLEVEKHAKVIKEKNRYKAIEGKTKKTIDMNHLVLASLVSDSVDIKVKSENEKFTIQDAKKMAEDLNRIKRQKLRIFNNGKLISSEIEILDLFNKNSNTINQKSLINLLKEFENDIENLTSHVYINSVTGDSNGFLRNGKKINKERVYFPGYIMVKANLTGELPHIIKSVTNVIGFLGETKGGEPVPLRVSEVNRMLGKVDELALATEHVSIPFTEGENVKVIDGPFNGFTGAIENVNEEKRKLEVMVKIFGRKTPLELSYMQVEKI